MLLEHDEEYLRSKRWKYEATSEGGFVCVVLTGFKPPAGYDHDKTNLLIRLPQGYPDATPDMFWFDPPLRLAATNAFPPNADQMEPYLGRTWQRFSRHFSNGGWKVGEDGLREYIALIRTDLRKWVRAAA